MTPLEIRNGLRQPLGSDSHYPQEAAARRASGSSRCFVRLVESEASDAIADHDNSDHEQNHDHDRHIVLHQPLPKSLEWPAHSRRSTRWATTGTATVEVAIAVNNTMTTAV